MIPILYDDSELNFDSNGIGRLSDCITCTVTEERNGIFECEFTYPISGVRYLDIEEGQIIYCPHDESRVPQAFIIYGRTAPIDGVVTFYAHHISYKLNNTVVLPFKATSIQNALSQLPGKCLPNQNFTYWTDKTTTGPYVIDTPRAVRGMLGGEEGSLLDVYGTGEYEWDMFTVKLHLHRGTDSGVEIRYGKNLIDITNEIDGGETYNAVVPFWRGEDVSGNDTLLTLPEGVVVYSGAAVRETYLTDHELNVIRTETDEPIEVPYQSIVAIPLDLSESFETKPTIAQLRQTAATVLAGSAGWEPKQSIEVDFVQLYQTEEYKDFEQLQTCRLCDTVSVYYPDLGVEAVKKKVVKTVYNVLLDRYDALELGELQRSFSAVVVDGLSAEIGNADGQNGGYIRIVRSSNGDTKEFLVLNEPSIDSATKILKADKDGVHISNRKYQHEDFKTILNSDWVLSDRGNQIKFDLWRGYIFSDSLYVFSGEPGDIQGERLRLSNSNTRLQIPEGPSLALSTFRQTQYASLTIPDGPSLDLNSTGYVELYATESIHVEASSNGGVLDFHDSYFDVTLNEAYFWFEDDRVVWSLSDDTSGLFMRADDVVTFSVDDETYISVGNKQVYDSGIYAPNVILKSTDGAATVEARGDSAKIYSSARGDSGAARFEATASGLVIDTGRQTSAHTGNLYLTTAGICYYANEASSSRKIKRDIEPIKDEGIDPVKLYDAEVVQFRYKDEYLDKDDPNKGVLLPGFIVEDLEKIYSAAVQKDEENPEESKNWTWSPYKLIPPMLKLIQDQKQEIDGLRAELDALKAEIEGIKTLLKED